MLEKPFPNSEQSPHHVDLADLVSRARRADADAFEILARRYSPVILAYFYGRIPASMDAADLLQEVLLNAFRNLSSLRDDTRFGPWLLRIAKSKHVDAIRAHQRLKSREFSGGSDGLEDTGEAPAVRDHALHEAIRATIDNLSDRYRMVIVLRVFEDLPFADIASRLDLKESTVRMRHKRGMDILRKSLRRKGFTE